MSKKELNTETKNVETAQPQMSKEQMEQFIKENNSIVPRNRRKQFEALSLEEKVAKIRYYIQSKKQKEENIEKNKLENRVKDLFDRRHATTEDVLRVIEFCKKYIESTKEAEINKLQTEIDRLSSLKRTLENN
jgi:hypothetical protein